jgi:hypothetical protein
MAINKKKYFLIAPIIATIIIYTIQNDKKKYESLGQKNRKATQLKSYQQFQPQIYSHSKRSFDKKIPKISNSRLPSNDKLRNYDLLEKYIDMTGLHYDWSSQIFAIPSNMPTPKDGIILKSAYDINWIKSNEKPDNGMTVVKDKKSGKIGFYTGRIIITDANEEISNYLETENKTFYKITNTLIVELKNFEEAVNLTKSLEGHFPKARADVDLNFSKETPK